MTLVAVPTLDELSKYPHLATTLPPDCARTVLASLAGLLPVLIAQASQDTGHAEAAAPERMLTVEETAQRYERWLLRHKKSMPHSQPSRKTLLFPETRVAKWFATRKAC